VRTRPYDFQLRLFNQSHADIPHFIERLRALTERYPERFTVAEVGGADSEAEMKLFTRGGNRFHSAYGFNFLYADRLTASLVRQALGAWTDADLPAWPSWAFSNHDAPRVVSRWAAPAQRASMARMAMLLLACLRGNIFVYQGEELGLPQAAIPFEQLRDPEAIANWPLTLGRDGARTPMPWTSQPAERLLPGREMWLPIPPEHRALAVDAQQADPDSQLAYTRHVLAFRNRHQSLKRGSMRFLETPEGVLAFEREHDGERVLCLFNLGSRASVWQPENAESWRIVERSAPAADADVNGWHLAPLSGPIAERSFR
jgi:alpha-glucosidase